MHGSATQQWVARQRYIVADLSAGPVAFGPAEWGREAVTDTALPRLEDSDRDTNSASAEAASTVSVKFMAELSSFILSSVQHVFVGDLQWRNLHYAEKVVVPLMVFRNHRRFHPLRQEGGSESLADESAAGPANDLKVDLGVVETELRKLLLPEQELLLVPGAHHLHDHHHISTAVFKAIKQDSVFTEGRNGFGDRKLAAGRTGTLLLGCGCLHAGMELRCGPPPHRPVGLRTPPRREWRAYARAKRQQKWLLRAARSA